MPRSVMMAVTNSLGVMSNAGCAASTPSGAMRCLFTCTTSSTLRSSMGMSSPDGSDKSIVEIGAAT